MSRSLFLVAGEASGDLHGALLARALRTRDASLSLSGLGGPQMRAEGVALRQDLVGLAAVGLSDVLRHLRTLRHIFHETVAFIERERPAAVVLIDYPGFNLRLAKAVHALGIPVVYYISPQVWAWDEGRVAQLKRDVDLMLVVFQFEREWYAQRGMDVTWIGHPLLDVVKPTQDRQAFLTSLGLAHNIPTVSLVPGSRQAEVRRHIPLLTAVAARMPAVQFLMPRLTTLPAALFQPVHRHSNITVVNNQMYNCVAASDAALVASGTATLETAMLGCPLAIYYKTAWLTWWLGKQLVKLPYIGLVNVVAGEQVVPEFVQHKAQPKLLARVCTELLRHQELREAMHRELAAVKAKLGSPGAADRAAQIITEKLGEGQGAWGKGHG